MAAMSEEENSWQESVGLITILEAEPLEAMDSARVPATIDVAQEASAHGSSASRSFEVGDSMEPSELSSIVRKTGLKEEAASVKSVETARCYRNALAAVVRANTEKDEAIARANEAVTNANTARDAAVASANETVVRATTEKDEAIARANTARDAAVTWANEAAVRANVAVVIATTEKDEAVAREKTAREELAARDQEIAQTSNALAVALRIKAFGEAEWKHYFGDVGSAPPLPSDIATILDSTCPFWPNNKVRDTHLLVLIPATVRGVPFTLNLLGALVKYPRHGGYKTDYSYKERAKAQIGAASPPLGAASPPRSYWVLMTRYVLPDSRTKTYEAQKVMVAAHAGRVGLPYELPHALEAATAILMHHVHEGERLFGDRPCTLTRCQEVVNGLPVIVGGFCSEEGLVVSSSDGSSSSIGVSCLRKF